MRPRVTSVGLFLPPRPAVDFVYPAHIDRASLEALPARPGVYFFRNRSGRPIYIGKSINIRARVMAHLRTPEESAMLGATRRVDFIRTAGEIGALLLEARLIKEHQPTYNVKLKFFSESFALCLPNGADHPHAVGYSEATQAGNSLYGLFVSRAAAQEGLQALIRRHKLCPAMLGLETATLGRACFAHQIGHCLGACIGKESKATHTDRLRTALDQLHALVWPYRGPIGIIETDARWRQIHIIHHWAYIGSLEGRRRKIALPADRSIDIDTYKILAKPLAEGSLAIGACEIRQQAAYYIGPEAQLHAISRPAARNDRP